MGVWGWQGVVTEPESSLLSGAVLNLRHLNACVFQLLWTLLLSLCGSSCCSGLPTLLTQRWHSRQQQDWRRSYCGICSKQQEWCLKRAVVARVECEVVAGVNPVCQAARGAPTCAVECWLRPIVPGFDLCPFWCVAGLFKVIPVHVVGTLCYSSHTKHTAACTTGPLCVLALPTYPHPPCSCDSLS